MADGNDADKEPGFYDGFLAAAGLFANPVVFASLYNVAATGIGLEAGQYDLLGWLEGVSFLVVTAIIAAALFSKVTKGTGLSAGPLGLLGLSEGLSFLSLLGAILVFPGRELGVVGNPETAMINVPEVTAQVVAVVGPLVSSVVATVTDAASNVEMPADVSSIKLPDAASLKLPEGSPDLSSAQSLFSSIKLPDIKLPEGLPDVSSIKLPEGLPDVKLPDMKLPDLPDVSLPDVELPATSTSDVPE